MDETQSARAAYFSMEIALDPAIPTYSGGLGVLAGDTLRSAADLGVPVVAVTLLHRRGYFRQRLASDGSQSEEAEDWSPEAAGLDRLDVRAVVEVEGRAVAIAAWRRVVRGTTGHSVSVLLLDADLDENQESDRRLTDRLYGGDLRYRLAQETLLGVGGVRILRQLGCAGIEIFHMNEGHSALLTVELLDERLGERDPAKATVADVAAVRGRCVFTTHTPVPAGHDRFDRNLAAGVLGARRMTALAALGAFQDGELNMTYLALRSSRYVNGVAMKHGETSAGMFPTYPISAITNGVHAVTWASDAMRELFDRYLPPWRLDSLYLRYAVGIPVNEIQRAHAEAKKALLDKIGPAAARLRPDVFTIGFARRAAAYKRADLVFSDPARLEAIVRSVGPLQFVFAGKAHPRDEAGKALIRKIFEAAERLKNSVPVAYVENYDMEWGRAITAGVDLWLNTPQRPREASGTSGMKAALNGVPSLSVLDGWWVEGCLEGVTGWAIDGLETPEDPDEEKESIYDKLERVIVPMFYGRPSAFGAIRRSAISINGSYFNTERMVRQYYANAYFPGRGMVPGD